RTRSKPASSWTRAVSLSTAFENGGPCGATTSEETCGAIHPMNSTGTRPVWPRAVVEGAEATMAPPMGSNTRIVVSEDIVVGADRRRTLAAVQAIGGIGLTERKA